MARGKKYTDELKEKAYLMYATCGNINEVSRTLGIPYATVAGWLKAKAEAEPDKFDKVRDEKKKDFISKASTIIDKGLELLDKRFERALNQEQELDKAVEAILESEISAKEKQALINKVRALQLHDVKAITVAIGTLYDKRVLAKENSEKGEKTIITLDWKRNK